MPKKNLAELRKSKREERRRADNRFTWRMITVMLFLAVWTVFLYRFDWPVYIYAIPTYMSILYLLAYIYPRDFTILALYISGGALGLWLLTVMLQSPGRLLPLAYALFALAITVSAFVFWLLRRHKGFAIIGKRKIPVMPYKAKYRYLFAACGALAVSLALTAALGRTAAWFSLIVMFCYLFVMAVYYTVKLM